MENHINALAVGVVHYNFIRIHKTLRASQPPPHIGLEKGTKPAATSPHQYYQFRYHRIILTLKGWQMPDEPDNLVLQLLREIRAEQTQANDRIDGLGRAVAADIHDLDAKIDTKSKDLSDQIVGLRRAVVEYHSAVIGHGNIIADLEARVRRLEQRLGPETH